MQAPGARAMLSCKDRKCCLNGLESTLKNPKAHYLRQRHQAISRMAAVPEAVRGLHFLGKELPLITRTARQAAKLRVDDTALAKALQKSNERLDRMEGIFEELHGMLQDAPRCRPPERRISSKRHQAAGAR
jgi:hypothetical protein